MPERFEALTINWWYGRISAAQAERKLEMLHIIFNQRAENGIGLRKRIRS